MRDAPIPHKRRRELDVLSYAIVVHVFGERFTIPIDIKAIPKALEIENASGFVDEVIAMLASNRSAEHSKFEEEGVTACMIGFGVLQDANFRKNVFPGFREYGKKGPIEREVLYFAEGLLLPWGKLRTFAKNENSFDPAVVSDAFMAPLEWVVRRMTALFG